MTPRVVVRERPSWPVALTAESVVRHYRRIAWGLLGVLLAGVLGLTAWGLVPLCLRPRARYVDTLLVYVAGGVAEWIVRLEIAGETVEARCMSEREALRIKEAAR